MKVWFYRLLKNTGAELGNDWNTSTTDLITKARRTSLDGRTSISVCKEFGSNGIVVKWYSLVPTHGLLNMVTHRVGGPAITHYDEDGKIVAEKYFWCGKKHRPVEEGPAWITNFKGRTPSRMYYLLDKLVDDVHMHKGRVTDGHPETQKIL